MMDPVETRVHERDILLTEKGDDERVITRSFFPPLILNTVWGIIKLLTLIYCLFASCSLIMIFAKHSITTIQFGLYNIILELIICIFVIHDALSSGGWRPGVTNSLWLTKFTKAIPYYSYNQYFTSIPKNYLRAVLLLFVASINNTNDTYKPLQYVRDLNVVMIVFSLCFLFIGYLGKIKTKFISHYNDWIMENNLDFHSKQQTLYETKTFCGWISMVYNILFFVYAIVVYALIIATLYDSLPIYVIFACISKCFLSILIIMYLILHRRVYIITINWSSAFILLFSLNISLNVLYDFDLQLIPIHEYVIYAWCLSLVIELSRFIFVYIQYRTSIYRYYTPFKLIYLQIAEWGHFWIIKHGITKIGLVLILFGLPFLYLTLTLDWFDIDMEFTPFFDWINPLDVKMSDLEDFVAIFEKIYDEIYEFVDAIDEFDVPDGVICAAIIAAFAAIFGASILPGASSAAAGVYQIVRIQKILKRIIDLFRRIYKAIGSLLSKIKRIVTKTYEMKKRVYQFLKILNKITPTSLGMASLMGLFGIVFIPGITVVITLILSFLDRSLRFNKFQTSAYNHHMMWLCFSSFLLLLNIANLWFIISMKTILEDIFVFETVVFESKVLLLDGYSACFVLHLLVITGLFLFILDRLFLVKCCRKVYASFYEGGTDQDIILKSYIKCKSGTPSVQECVSYLVENYEFDATVDLMSYQDMEECVINCDGLQDENEEIVHILLGICWCCVEYNKFDKSKAMKHKEWEYFLTAYKIGSFPMTQPLQARNMDNVQHVKELIDTVYASNDNIMYYDFNKQSSKEVETLNVIACKQIIIYLRTGVMDDADIDRISDDDLAVKLLLNLSKKQLNNVLTRFDQNIWELIISVDTIHDCDEIEYKRGLGSVMDQSLSAQKYGRVQTKSGADQLDGNSTATSIAYRSDTAQKDTKEDVLEEKYDDTAVIELTVKQNEETDTLPEGWRKIANDGLVYYHNDDTDETQWEIPKDTKGEEGEHETKGEIKEEEEEEEELPSDWEQITNNDGLIYYHNEQLNQTQWERPRPKKERRKTIKIETETEIKTRTVCKSVATQTEVIMNGIFKTKAIYQQFFEIALKDMSIDTKIMNETNFEICAKRNDEQAIDFIDAQWIKMNETLLMAFDTDNDFIDDDDDDDVMDDRFPPNKVLNALKDEEKAANIIISATEHGVISSEKWFKYLICALMEYEQCNTDSAVIIVHPSEEHYEVWCVYIILSLLVTVFAVFSLTNYGFISFEYEPDIATSMSVSSLVKAKEGLSSEWELDNFDGIGEFADVGNDQFSACDIGSVFMLIAGELGLSQFKAFDSMLSAMMDVFSWDIPFIDLLDEIFDFDLDLLNFPMIDILSWPSITIPFYYEWYFILLFAPLFCLFVCCALFVIGLKKKRIEIDKPIIAGYIMFAAFSCFVFTLSLGSMVSAVATFLPNSRTFITYEYGYYYIILSHILVMFIALMIFIDVLFGEPIPLLSNIFHKNNTNA